VVSTLLVITVFLFGFALGGLAVSLRRRQSMTAIRQEFEQELERISARRLERTQDTLDQMRPRSRLHS
jgi:CHASE1-domain containing sensor protein